MALYCGSCELNPAERTVYKVFVIRLEEKTVDVPLCTSCLKIQKLPQTCCECSEMTAIHLYFISNTQSWYCQVCINDGFPQAYSMLQSCLTTKNLPVD